MKQPHNTDASPAFPQGPAVISAIGCCCPVSFHPGGLRSTHRKMLKYQLAENGKKGAGRSCCHQQRLLQRGAISTSASEKYLADTGKLVTLTKERASHGTKALSRFSISPTPRSKKASLPIRKEEDEGDALRDTGARVHEACRRRGMMKAAAGSTLAAGLRDRARLGRREQQAVAELALKLDGLACA